MRIFGTESGSFRLIINRYMPSSGSGGGLASALVNLEAGGNIAQSSGASTLTITSSDNSIESSTTSEITTTPTLDLKINSEMLGIDLSYKAEPGQGTIENTGGSDAIIPATDAINAGLLLPEEKTTISDAGIHIPNTNNPHSVSKAQVGLSNVENVALSTWPGSVNINTLGTVTAGIFQGSPVQDAYIASSASWNAKLDQATADTLYQPIGNYQPLDSDLTAYAALATTGIVHRTGSGTSTTIPFGADATKYLDNTGAFTVPPGKDVPDGGLQYQILEKQSGVDGDVIWKYKPEVRQDFPSNPYDGQIFVLALTNRRVRYIYDGTQWNPELAEGATYTVYVGTGGTNNQLAGDTAGIPYATISYAIEQCPENTDITIRMLPGSYTESITYTSQKLKTITLTADSDTEIVSSGTISVHNGYNLTLSNVTNVQIGHWIELLSGDFAGQFLLVTDINGSIITAGGMYNGSISGASYRIFSNNVTITGNHVLSGSIYDIDVRKINFVQAAGGGTITDTDRSTLNVYACKYAGSITIISFINLVNSSFNSYGVHVDFASTTEGHRAIQVEGVNSAININACYLKTINARTLNVIGGAYVNVRGSYHVLSQLNALQFIINIDGSPTRWGFNSNTEVRLDNGISSPTQDNVKVTGPARAQALTNAANPTVNEVTDSLVGTS